MLLALLGLIGTLSLPPKPDHYVTDRAHVLSDADVQALDHELADFERATSDQILVYVDQHIPEGTTLEEMGAEAMRQWGVGQKGKDNGAILFIFVADHRMRIEVGYGLEGTLTDAKSKSIVEEVIKPELQRGAINAAVDRGTAAMMATIRGEPYQGTGETVREKLAGSGRWETSTVVYTILFLLAGVGQFITAKHLSRKIVRKLSWREAYASPLAKVLAIGPPILVIVFVASMPASFIQDAAACYVFLLLVPFFFGMFAGAVSTADEQTVTFSSSGTSSSSNSSSYARSDSSYSSSGTSSSSHSSSSSSTFSGGGGSGGGGGASGSW